VQVGRSVSSGLDLNSPEGRVILARAQSGDRPSLDIVLGSLQEALYRHIVAIVGDADEARDALQETLMRIARKLASLRQPVWIRAWAYRIATREAVRQSMAGRRWRESVRDTDALDALPAPDIDPAGEAIAMTELPFLLSGLPPASEAVIRMRYIDQLTFVEIAEALEIPVGTVKSRLGYGLAVLRRTHRQADRGRA